MIDTTRVYRAWINDKNRHIRAQTKDTYLARDLRWRACIHYCWRKDAEREAKLTAEYGPPIKSGRTRQP